MISLPAAEVVMSICMLAVFPLGINIGRRSRKL